MLLVLWDIDGTLVHSASHGRLAFDDAFRALTGRPAAQVAMAGRTDQQIALELLGGDRERLPQMLDELTAALEGRRAAIAAEGRHFPGVPDTLTALHARADVAQSLLTGNVLLNAVVKVSAFGLERWLDVDVGAYGSDPHEERSDLVAIAQERATAKYGALTETVLVGDTPLDVRAAHAAGARAVAIATGTSDVEALRASGAEAVLADLSDTDAALAAILGG